MKDLIRISSAVLTIIAGVVLLILWIISANDKGTGDSGDRKCRGITQLFHEALADGDFQESAALSTNFDDGLNTWVKNNKEAYPILIAFGVIIGVFWMVTGAIGFYAKGGCMAKLYLLLGVATYVIFVVLFPIIVERFTFLFDNSSTYGAYLWGTKGGCRSSSNWTIKHQMDGYEEFWGASLVGFVLGAYQIAAAIYLCATDSTSDPSVPKKA